MENPPTKDAPAFDFYPERFWFAVDGWSEADIVRYFRLLSQLWMRDGLPTCAKELALLARGRVSARVLAKFPIAADGMRRNAFLEEVRTKQRIRIMNARGRSQKMHEARYGKHAPRSATGSSHLSPHSIYTRPTLDQALDACGQISVNVKEAEDWWNSREASG